MERLMTSHYYFEHTPGYDTSIWVQWLDEKGRGMDVEKWDAELFIDQGTATTIAFNHDARDLHSSSFRFDIDSSETFTLGLFTSKVTVQENDTNASEHIIARGAVHLLSEEPA
jgi:hypothetical protein